MTVRVLKAGYDGNNNWFIEWIIHRGKNILWSHVALLRFQLLAL